VHAKELKAEFGEGKIEDYRSGTKSADALGTRSLQVTFKINQFGRGGAFVDTDQYAYNESPKGFFGHLKEFIEGPFRRNPCK
jgi:hypothetical protein